MTSPRGAVAATVLTAWLAVSGAAAVHGQNCNAVLKSDENLGAATGDAWRTGGTLFVRTRRDVLEFTDGPCDDGLPDVYERCKRHKFVAHDRVAEVYLIGVRLFEGENFIFIDRSTGQTESIDGQPVSSPSGLRMAVASGSATDEAHYDPNTFAVWKKERVGDRHYWIVEARFRFADKFALCVDRWVNDDHVMLRGAVATQTDRGEVAELFPVVATWNGWYWMFDGGPPSMAGPKRQP